MLLNQLSKSEGQRLLATYKKSEKKIKAKLKACLEKGNNPEYLRRAQRSINQEIKTLEQQFNNYSQKRLPLIYNQGVKISDKEIDKFENTFDIDNSFGKVDRSRLMIIADNTQRGLSGITTVIGRQSADYLRRIGLMTARDITIGSETWLSASKAMTKELENKGFFYVDYKLKSGAIRKVPADVYSRMVARTTSTEVARLSTTDRITSRGYDLVVVIGLSSFPESPCIPYQGKTLSISGTTAGYTALEEARANGFNHPNCIHSLGFSDDNLKFVH